MVAGSPVDSLFAQGNNIRSAEPVVSAARFVPPQALMTVSFYPDRKTWSQLDRFHTPTTKKLFNQAFASFQSTIPPKYNFERDIQPWLGSMTFAVLPRPSLRSQNKESSESKFLFSIEVTDLDRANKLMEAVKIHDGSKVTLREDYKGVKIIQIDYDNGKQFIYTFVDKHLVFAEQEVVLKHAIDTYKSKVSLASVIANDNLDLKNPVCWLYMHSLAKFVKQYGTEDTEIPAESLAVLNSIESINLGVGIDIDGIRLKASTKLKSNSPYLNVFKPFTDKIISQFPSETIGLLSGSNIKAHWQQFVGSVERLSEVKNSLNEFRQTLKSSPLALDLDKDIFGWMGGEFAFAGIPTHGEGESILATIGFTPVLVLQTSDRRATESLLNKLNTFFKNNSGLVETKTIGSTPVTQWIFPTAPEALLSYGWHRNDTLFLTVGGSLAKVLASKSKETLQGSSAFRAIAGSLPQPNLGYFYLDMDKTWKLVTEKSPGSANIGPEVTAILSRVRGIGVTVTAPDRSTTKLEMLLSLKQRGFGGIWY